jgi:hypothetical protein
MTDAKDVSYLVEEMKAARQRIDAEIATMNQFEVLSITSIGAIYLIFFQFKIVDPAGLIFLSLLPVLICGYGLFRYRAHAAIVRIHEEYIKEKIETKVLGLGEKGLVGFYDDKKRSTLKQARFTFWTVIFLISFSIFILAAVCPEYILRINPPSSAAPSQKAN